MGSGIERPAVTGFHHVSAIVSDVDVSATWYQRVLGLQRLPATFSHHGDGAGDAALLLDTTTGVMIELRGGITTTVGRAPLNHLAFGVADRETLEGWAAWLDTLGIPHDGVTDRTEPTSYATLEFRDPDGIALEFIHFPTVADRRRPAPTAGRTPGS